MNIKENVFLALIFLTLLLFAAIPGGPFSGSHQAGVEEKIESDIQRCIENNMGYELSYGIINCRK